MIQEHPDKLCQQKACEEVVDGFQFNISNIMDNTEIEVQVIPLTKNNVCIVIKL